jgi:hypothetical protein
MGGYAMKYELTESEKKNLTELEMKIFEEGNSKQIEAMNAQRVIIEQEAIKSGRYPLWLAVEMMTDNFKARWVLRDNLDDDARHGRIPLFRKGDVLSEEYSLFSLVLKESDEYFWDDLNAWLKEKYPMIDFKFPKPGAPAGKVEAVPVTTPSGDDVEEQAPDDHDETLAALFEPLPVEALAKMFMIDLAQWKKWQDKAKAKGLIKAREGRAKFNPYKAGVWLVSKGEQGWDVARLYRTLANNLPARSHDKKDLLTGGID